jgi:hypothetical protein
MFVFSDYECVIQSLLLDISLVQMDNYVYRMASDTATNTFDKE